MDEQCRIGTYWCVLHNYEPDPTFVSNFVLVPNGKSGQDFRACINVMEANTCINQLNLPEYPTEDGTLGPWEVSHGIYQCLLHVSNIYLHLPTFYPLVN